MGQMDELIRRHEERMRPRNPPAQPTWIPSGVMADIIHESAQRQDRNWRAHLRRRELEDEYLETVDPEIDEFGCLLPGYPTFEEWKKGEKRRRNK